MVLSRLSLPCNNFSKTSFCNSQSKMLQGTKSTCYSFQLTEAIKTKVAPGISMLRHLNKYMIMRLQLSWKIQDSPEFLNFILYPGFIMLFCPEYLNVLFNYNNAIILN